jgi:hypothetical protein
MNRRASFALIAAALLAGAFAVVGGGRRLWRRLRALHGH